MLVLRIERKTDRAHSFEGLLWIHFGECMANARDDSGE